MKFREMRLLVFYDLPTTSKTAIKQATKFRNFLVKSGFIMLQESIYVRFCLNIDYLNKVRINIVRNKPSVGDVRLLTVTERQYETIDIIVGEKSKDEMNSTKDTLVVI